MKRYKIHQILVGHYNSVMACDFSPDGAILATASRDTRVILWDPASGKIIMLISCISVLFEDYCCDMKKRILQITGLDSFSSRTL
jgi:WD40 repeat protein